MPLRDMAKTYALQMRWNYNNRIGGNMRVSFHKKDDVCISIHGFNNTELIELAQKFGVERNPDKEWISIKCDEIEVVLFGQEVKE